MAAHRNDACSILSLFQSNHHPSQNATNNHRFEQDGQQQNVANDLEDAPVSVEKYMQLMEVSAREVQCNNTVVCEDITKLTLYVHSPSLVGPFVL